MAKLNAEKMLILTVRYNPAARSLAPRFARLFSACSDLIIAC